VALDATQARQLAEFSRLLTRWNAVHNLTAIRSADEVETRHLLDSLVMVPFVRRFAGNANMRVLDVGSGAGLPGVPIAIACPDVHVTLLDSLRKKCAFLMQARVELQLSNVEIVHARVERWQAMPFPVIVSRAFASLRDFVELTRHLLRADGVWLAMKGPAAVQDAGNLPKGVSVAEIAPVEVPGLNETRNVVVLRAQ